MKELRDCKRFLVRLRVALSPPSRRGRGRKPKRLMGTDVVREGRGIVGGHHTVSGRTFGRGTRPRDRASRSGTSRVVVVRRPGPIREGTSPSPNGDVEPGLRRVGPDPALPTRVDATSSTCRRRGTGPRGLSRVCVTRRRGLSSSGVPQTVQVQFPSPLHVDGVVPSTLCNTPFSTPIFELPIHSLTQDRD